MFACKQQLNSNRKIDHHFLLMIRCQSFVDPILFFSQTEYNEWEENLCKEKTKSSYQPWIFSQKKHLSVFTQQEKREKNIDHRQDIIILIS